MPPTITFISISQFSILTMRAQSKRLKNAIQEVFQQFTKSFMIRKILQLSAIDIGANLFNGFVLSNHHSTQK
jgi:hypothetical protein